jgi:TonB family protein
MTSLYHALNITTLATWLSVAGFGVVGVVVPEWRSHPKILAVDAAPTNDEDFTLGDTRVAETAASSEESSSPEVIDSPATPPESPTLADHPPLPNVPIFSGLAAKAPAVDTSNRTSRPVSKSASTHTDRAATEASNAARFAAGHMPERPYPTEARSRNQTGSVVVEFVAGSDGRVISAKVKTPSPWPLLNEEAIRTVLGWSFPAGEVMTLERRIVFQLN